MTPEMKSLLADLHLIVVVTGYAFWGIILVLVLFFISAWLWDQFLIAAGAAIRRHDARRERAAQKLRDAEKATRKLAPGEVFT